MTFCPKGMNVPQGLLQTVSGTVGDEELFSPIGVV